MSNKTCILGAGLSGLVTMKHFKQKGLPFECFEKGPQIGGNWNFQNKNGLSSIYRSLHINTSKKYLELEGYPIPQDMPDFPHHSEVFNYLKGYADHFQLENIRFNQEIKRANWDEKKKLWFLTLPNHKEKCFKNLIICSGHHWDSHTPVFPGHFAGETLHSHNYIDPQVPLVLKNKRVLIVGLGNSAVDIASELSQRSLQNNVFVSTRRGAHIIPKYIFGRPLDQLLPTLPLIPLSLQRKISGLVLRMAVGNLKNYGLPRPDHRLLEAHPTVSGEFLLRKGSGDINVVPQIKELQESRVLFTNGQSHPFDVIIYSTGYKTSFPFFEEGLLPLKNNHLPLFKRVFLPGKPNLMFIGLGQPIPGLFPFIEEQAKWVSSYLSGQYKLPSPSRMEQEIKKDELRDNGHFVSSLRHTMQIDFHVYKRNLKKEIKKGCKRI
ncbi:MAG: NAD(P)-binding domain-containing protein [Bdellovibrionota bacterium]|nr:NAD(P)-binding domain-containing protein [Bdellovibrionota bacterium]